MTCRFTLVLIGVCCLAGCLRSGPRNSNCEWPSDSAAVLDVRDASQQRHLSDDAELAEDLAIRYADVHRGPHSGHFEGMAEYGRTRDECMARLFQTVAGTHKVSEAQVRQSLGRRRIGFDLIAGFSFAVLYVLAAYLAAGRANRLYPDGESVLARAAVVLYVSVIVSLAGVLLGELWSGLMENLRVGSGHLSYRGARVPWSHHSLALFAAGAVLFWIAAAFRYRATARAGGNSKAARRRLFDLDPVA